MSKKIYRYIQCLMVLATLLVLMFSIYLEFFQGIKPCPLCVMQRACVFILLLSALLGLYLKTFKRAERICIFQCFIALAGIFFSARQVWLQAQPPGTNAMCMPSIEVLKKYFPLKDQITAYLWGSHGCAEKTWSYLSLSLPQWSLMYFCGVFLSALVMIIFIHKRQLNV